MSRNKVLGIIFIVIGVVLLLIGTFFSQNNVNSSNDDDFLRNTTQFFDGITCYNNLCLSNLKISNSSTKATKVEFDLINNNKTMVASSTLSLRFDTGNKISFTYKSLESNETIKINIKTKNNLSEVMSYKLEKN